MRTDSLVN